MLDLYVAVNLYWECCYAGYPSAVVDYLLARWHRNLTLAPTLTITLRTLGLCKMWECGSGYV